MKVMFEKAASLNQIDGLVIPKQGSFDGSYVAAGAYSIIFFVIPGEEGSIRGALSGLRQLLAIESPLKVMRNAFYFTSKVLFIFKILSLEVWN